jgi:predicted hydrolase (HD superfamily)
VRCEGAKQAHRLCSVNRWAKETTDERDEAWALLAEFTKNESLLKHALAVEAAMRHYARKYGENEDTWGAVGLLHDFDYEVHPTLDNPQEGQDPA